MGSFPLRSGQLFLCIGDSITDCGRRAERGPLGDGYVSLFRELLILRRPELELRWLNRGINGNKVTDLRVRWQDDVLREKPDWLSIKVGINDAYSHVRGAEGAVSPEQFRTAYGEILELTRSLGKVRLVLIDPFFLSTDTQTGSWRTQVLQALPDYLEVVRAMAEKHKALHIRTHQLFQRQLKHRPTNDFAGDAVHPYRIGHLLLAEALYDAVAGT